jgi:hypothetical protein
MKRYIFAVFFACVSLPTFAAKQGVYVHTSAAGGYNPATAQLSASVFYRLPFSSDTAPLWNETKTDFGITGSITPVDYSGTAFVTFEPLAIFSLKMSGACQRYYASLGYGYRKVESPDSEYSNSALSHVTAESKTAFRFSAEPTLRYKYERFIVTNTFSYTYIEVKSGDPYYYEPYSDTIHKKKDHNYANSASLLFVINDHFIAGVNDYYQKVPSTQYRSNRIASVFVYSKKNGESELSLALLAGSFTENKYYKGKLFTAFYIGKSFMI